MEYNTKKVTITVDYDGEKSTYGCKACNIENVLKSIMTLVGVEPKPFDMKENSHINTVVEYVKQCSPVVVYENNSEVEKLKREIKELEKRNKANCEWWSCH